MKPIQLLTIIVLLTTLCNSHEQFSEYLDPWNSLATIQGEFDKNRTLFKYATCNPCDYMVIVYKDYVRLLIDNPQEGKKENVMSFEFRVVEQHKDESWWDFDSHKFSLDRKYDIQEQIERTSKKGLQWSYELTLPIQGLILKGHSFYLYVNLIPLVTFIFSILIFVTFPYSGQARKQQTIEIPRRTPLFSLIILAQLQHIVFVQIIILMIKYIIHDESFLINSFWYFLYMIAFSFVILQIVFLYDAIKTRYNGVFAKVKAVRMRDIGLVMTFFLGIYGGSAVLLVVGKGLWVWVYFGLYLFWQIGSSLLDKAYPYLPLTAYYFVIMGYQMFLANFEPLFWFEQQTWTEISSYWGILIVIFIIGSLVQKFFIGIQNVNQVLFEQSKTIEMGDTGSAKATESNLET